MRAVRSPQELGRARGTDVAAGAAQPAGSGCAQAIGRGHLRDLHASRRPKAVTQQVPHGDERALAHGRRDPEDLGDLALVHQMQSGQAAAQPPRPCRQRGQARSGPPPSRSNWTPAWDCSTLICRVASAIGAGVPARYDSSTLTVAIREGSRLTQSLGRAVAAIHRTRRQVPSRKNRSSGVASASLTPGAGAALRVMRVSPWRDHSSARLRFCTHLPRPS